MSTAVVVQNRSGTRHVQALELKCDDKEIPESELLGKTDYWIAGVGAFEGVAALLNDDDTLVPGYEVGVTGTTAIGVCNGRLIGIVSPNQATAPAVWIAASITSLKITTKGTIGVFNKRPAAIQVQCDGWTIALGHVAKLNRSTNRAQKGQEASLINALTPSGSG